jgi:asparagine synthase (glutamine-hydrolysing)
MSMGVSLEVRVPFIDHVFLESAWRVPGRRRCEGIPNKRYLRKLTMPYLGDAYKNKAKQGFIFPFEAWLRNDNLLTQIKSTLSNESLAKNLGLRSDTILHIFREFSHPNSKIPWSRIWSLFVLFKWCESHQVIL